MVLSLLLAVLLKGDASFCPSAPSPYYYQETLPAFSKGPSGKFDQTHSAQTVQKLVEKKTGGLLGWLYLDEYAWTFVGLTAKRDPRTYRWFKMEGRNMHKLGTPTEALLQTELRLPPWAEIARC